MSEFEYSLLSNVDVNTRTYDDVLYSEETLVKYFKDWQPPKEPLEVPQFLAEWYKNNQDSGVGIGVAIGNLFQSRASTPLKDYDEMMTWFTSNLNSAIKDIVYMFNNGYKTEREKVYKVPLVKNSNGEVYRLLQDNLGGFITVVPSTYIAEDSQKDLFTETEIKEINENYWAFAVEDSLSLFEVENGK